MEGTRRTVAGTLLSISIRLAIAFLLTSAGNLAVRAQIVSNPPHPAHIHSGSCEDLGDIVHPLTDVALATAGEAFGSASAIPVQESVTTIEASLSDILAAPHAINVHESADAIQNYIACGDIGGRAVDGKLLIGLRELHDSSYQGVAILDGSIAASTTVTVYLAHETKSGETEQAAAATVPNPTAAAQPTAEPAQVEPTAEPTGASSAEEVPVDIVEFSFSPDPVEILVGDTVTWTNQGTVPHTATGEDRSVLQSGTIPTGASFSQVFDQAGEFGYFCEFHPNMLGTITVK